MNVYSLPIVDSKAYQYYLNCSSHDNWNSTTQQEFIRLLTEEVILNTEGRKTDINFHTLVYKMSSGVIPGPVKLPTGYTELAYIESTGTQWIDTGITVDQNYAMTFTFKETELVNHIFCGAWIDNNYHGFGVYRAFGNSIYDDYANEDIAIVADQYTNITRITKKFNLTFVNDECKIVHKPAEFTSTETFKIGHSDLLSNGTHAKFRGQIYNLTLLTPNLVFNGIPCKNQNNEVGLYDTVSKRFFGNSGTGTFIAPEPPSAPDLDTEYSTDIIKFKYGINRSIVLNNFHNITIYVDDNPNDFVSVLYNDSFRYTGKEHLTASLANLYNNSGKIYFETVPYKDTKYGTYYNGIWDDNDPHTEKDFTYEADIADTQWSSYYNYYTYDYDFYTANTIYEQSSYWKREGITTHTYNNGIDSQIDGKAYFTGSKIYAAKAFSNTVTVLERITNISRTIPNHIFIDSYRYTKPYNFLGYFPQNDVGNWSTNTYSLIHWDLDDPDMYNPSYFPTITITGGTEETNSGTIDIENNSKLNEHIFNDAKYCDSYEVIANIYDTRPQLSQYNKEFLVSSVHFMNTYYHSLAEIYDYINFHYGSGTAPDLYNMWKLYKPDDTDPYIADELDTYYTASYNFSIARMAGEEISDYHRRILGYINDWAKHMCQFPKSYYISISAYFDEGYFPTFKENITGKTTSIVVNSIRDWQEQFEGQDGFKSLPIQITITEKIDDNFIYVDRYILVTNDTVEFTDDEGMISTTSEHTVQNGILHII